MRALFTKLPLAILGLAILTSCGKDGESGGSSSASVQGSISAGANIDQIRHAFNSTSLSHGITQSSDQNYGTSIYHGGSYFKVPSDSDCKSVPGPEWAGSSSVYPTPGFVIWPAA